MSRAAVRRSKRARHGRRPSSRPSGPERARRALASPRARSRLLAGTTAGEAAAFAVFSRTLDYNVRAVWENERRARYGLSRMLPMRNPLYDFRARPGEYLGQRVAARLMGAR